MVRNNVFRAAVKVGMLYYYALFFFFLVVCLEFCNSMQGVLNNQSSKRDTMRARRGGHLFKDFVSLLASKGRILKQTLNT